MSRRTARVPTPSIGTSPRPIPGPISPTRSIFNNGKPVKSAKDWTTKRRPELVELFDNDIVGRVPANVPAVHWEVVSTTSGSEDGIATITKRLVGHVDNSAYPAITVNIEVDLILPAAATKPVPAVVEITFAVPSALLPRRRAPRAPPRPPPQPRPQVRPHPPALC